MREDVPPEHQHTRTHTKPILHDVTGVDGPGERHLRSAARVRGDDLGHHEVAVVVILLVEAVLVRTVGRGGGDPDVVFLTQSLHLRIYKLGSIIEMKSLTSSEYPEPVAEKRFDNCSGLFIWNKHRSLVPSKGVNNVENIRGRFFIGVLRVILKIKSH